ncbi:MAG: Gfo/Idh/MocA family oxidoreductase [Firmicutes bacterium]|nr:Gfo/Idh/MocA family oxidoreductase [Bacillota bacterium]
MVKNYCIVGTGSRGISMYGESIVHHYSDVARLTGLCDVNAGRVAYAQRRLGGDIPTFTNFQEMLNSVECDTVIVTTKDADHDHYIVDALQHGKDVITEKPLTTTAEKANRILRAEKDTGRRVRVAFNYRYAPYKTEVKRLLKEGIVGTVHSVEFRWFLDTVHGADYFRRWHAKKANSGGLFVHKATHHFDLINWWLDLEPEEVVAIGSRQYYIPERMSGHGERCSTCTITDRCPFYLDLANTPNLRELYLDHEEYDHYWRDGCVFSEDIDIEDTMSALIRYPNGIHVTYALTAATPFEGWWVAFNGSRGRLEAFEPEAMVPNGELPNFSERSHRPGRQAVDWRFVEEGHVPEFHALTLRFYPLFGGVQTFSVKRGEGSHGGGDKRLQDDLFRGVNDDPLNHAADSRAGAMAMLIGAAANRSMAERRFVKIRELLDPDLL